MEKLSAAFDVKYSNLGIFEKKSHRGSILIFYAHIRLQAVIKLDGP